MKLWVLGSGSRGNAVLLECGGTRVLIDAGFPATVVARRMRTIGVEPESVQAVIITHEHSDHVRGTALGARRYGWSIHATAGTVAGWPPLVDVPVHTFAAGATLTFDRVDIETVRTSHDAADPVAVIATCRTSGTRAGIVYDLGCATEPVRRAVRDLDLLVLEANHDEEMLHTGPYPFVVRRRIASRSGHLSNRDAAELARECAHAGLREIVLAHLSQVNNEPSLATSAVRGSVARTRFRGGVHAAPQDGVLGPFSPALSRTPAAVQLDLGM